MSETAKKTAAKKTAAAKSDAPAEDTIDTGDLDVQPARGEAGLDTLSDEEGGSDLSGAQKPSAMERVGGPDESGLIEVTLAHPISRDDDKRLLGLDPETKCNVHDKIKVSFHNANRLIEAGLVQVDPSDRDAVNAILYGTPADES